MRTMIPNRFTAVGCWWVPEEKDKGNCEMFLKGPDALSGSQME